MKELTASAYLKLASALALALAMLVAFANWRIDPLQFYRRASYPPLLSDQLRFQNPGLARNYDYDTIYLGTSVSLGFETGPRTLNLAMQGASAHEQALLLAVALRTGKVRQVIWDVNYEFLRGRPDWVSDYDGAFPAYFYDANPLNELPHYLLNLDTTKDTLRILLHAYSSRPLSDLTRPRDREHGRPRVLKHWQRELGHSVFAREPASFENGKPIHSFVANYAAAIRAHPEVRFDVFFPPQSFVYFALMRADSPAAFDAMLEWKKDVMRELAPLPNASLFDFQGTPEIVLDLRRYADAVHFDEGTHREILDSIASRRQLATPDNLATSAALLRREATVDWPARHPD